MHAMCPVMSHVPNDADFKAYTDLCSHCNPHYALLHACNGFNNAFLFLDTLYTLRNVFLLPTSCGGNDLFFLFSYYKFNKLFNFLPVLFMATYNFLFLWTAKSSLLQMVTKIHCSTHLIET